MINSFLFRLLNIEFFEENAPIDKYDANFLIKAKNLEYIFISTQNVMLFQVCWGEKVMLPDL